MAARSLSGRTLADAPDDVALVGRVAGGDTRAFETLFHRYQPRIKRFVERMTRRPHTVDEIVNDTMLVIWRRAGMFNLRSRVSTWILGIARNRSLKALERADDAIAFDADALASAEPDPQARLLRQEAVLQLVRAVRTLPAEQRAVVELACVDGRGYREIAAILGCPVATVKTRMFHARRRLKAMLEDTGGNAA